MSTGISLTTPSFDPSHCHVRKSSNFFVAEGKATTHMLCYRLLWRQKSDIRTEDCPTSNSSSASASQHINNQYNHLLQSQSAQHFFIHQFQSAHRSINPSINMQFKLVAATVASLALSGVLAVPTEVSDSRALFD